MRKQLRIAVAVLALLAPPLAAQAPEGREGSMDVVPVLTVSGSGQARVTPDEAVVRMGVVAQAKTARAAQNEVNRVAGAVLEAVRKLGIEAKDVQTSGLSLSPLYAQTRPGEEDKAPQITGYQASNSVTVRIEELAKAGPVIDAGLSAGANSLEGVTFGLRNDEAARAEALTNAAQQARSKAQTLAKSLGLRLGDIVEVSEGGVSVQPPPYPRFAAMRMESSVADTPVSAGQVEVQANVTLRYRIAQ